MNRNLPVLSVLAAACLGLMPSLAHAAESYDNCTGFIDSLPATITTSGTWCLRKHLSTAIAGGKAVEIKTNNVTIDCNDFRIGGLPAGEDTNAYGIGATNRRNITVRHCGVRGFLIGILLRATDHASGGGHVVENNRVDANVHQGILVEGDGSVVRGNLVQGIGSSSRALEAVGIQTRFNVDTLDNTVQDVQPAAGINDAFGILAFDNESGSISANRVRGVLGGTSTAYSQAITLGAAGRVTLRDNNLGGQSATKTGIECNGATHSVALNNVINRFETGLNGCNDAGNAIVP